jgi:hypothetical protein
MLGLCPVCAPFIGRWCALAGQPVGVDSGDRPARVCGLLFPFCAYQTAWRRRPWTGAGHTALPSTRWAQAGCNTEMVSREGFLGVANHFRTALTRVVSATTKIATSDAADEISENTSNTFLQPRSPAAKIACWQFTYFGEAAQVESRSSPLRIPAQPSVASITAIMEICRRLLAGAPVSVLWRSIPLKRPQPDATVRCRRSQSSAAVLANSAGSCSRSLPITARRCSHCLPARSPTSARACYRSVVLTLSANGENGSPGSYLPRPAAPITL